MDANDIVGNKLAREEAEQVIELMEIAVGGLDHDFQKQRFYKIVHDWTYERLTVKPKPKVAVMPMTDVEVAWFEKQTLEFGKYKSTAISEVPIDYLCWFSDQTDDELKKKVKRYLASQRGRDRVRTEGEE